MNPLNTLNHIHYNWQQRFTLLGLGLIVSLCACLWMGTGTPDRAGREKQSFEELDDLFEQYVGQNLDSAQLILRQQEEVLRTQEEEMQYRLNQGMLQLKLGELDSALMYNKVALGLASSKENKAKVYSQFGNYYYKTSQFDSSVHYFQTALRLLPVDAKAEKASLNHNLANIFFSLSALDSARIYADISHSQMYHLPEDKALPLLASNASLRGNIFLYSSKYDSAYKVFLEALELNKYMDNRRGMADAYAQIAGVYQFQSRFEEALPLYRKALNIGQEVGGERKNLIYLLNLGTCNLETGNHEEALGCFRESFSRAGVIKAYTIRGNSAGNLGATWMKLERTDSAAHYFKTALSLFEQLNNPYGSCMTHLGLGEVYREQGNVNAAIKSTRSGLALAQQLESPDLLKSAYEAFYELYSTENRADSALYYFQQAAIIEDSIASQSVRKEIENLKIKYETKITEEENLLLSLKLDQAKVKAERFGLILFSLIAGGILLLSIPIFALVIVVQNRRKQLAIADERLIAEQAQTELIQFKLKNARKTVEEKNQLLQNLENDLKGRLETGGDLHEDLYLRFNVDKDWAQLIFEFEMAYPGFFDKLKARTSGLTKNDLRLAALMKLKLSNKEIALSLNISPDGVKKAKTRFKKKLDLPSDQNISEFIEAV